MYMIASRPNGTNVSREVVVLFGPRDDRATLMLAPPMILPAGVQGLGLVAGQMALVFAAIRALMPLLEPFGRRIDGAPYLGITQPGLAGVAPGSRASHEATDLLPVAVLLLTTPDMAVITSWVVSEPTTE